MAVDLCQRLLLRAVIVRPDCNLSDSTEFVRKPIACLTLASFLATNTGDVARKHIQDPELLSFIDVECYCWSTVLAGLTPMMNAGMVFCDRHYGGINYPKGGVGRIAQALAGETAAVPMPGALLVRLWCRVLVSKLTMPKMSDVLTFAMWLNNQCISIVHRWS